MRLRFAVCSLLTLAGCAPVEEISRDTRRADAVVDRVSAPDVTSTVDAAAPQDANAPRDVATQEDRSAPPLDVSSPPDAMALDASVAVDVTPVMDSAAPLDVAITPDVTALDVPVDAGALTDVGPERPSPGTSPAGGPCVATVDCRVGLMCDTTVRGGFCTANCRNSVSQATEQMQCGGAGSTCLTSDDPPDESSFCVQTCRPGPGPGCRPGNVCTGFWASHAMGRPDTAGCFPFCFSNADCVAGEVCNTRTGACGATGSNPAALQDGQPCVIPAMGAPSPCRGICFRVVSTGTLGICGSLIDLAQSSACPDGPAVQPLSPTGDNLAYCVFRDCTATNCCPAGTVCEGTAGMGTCSIDDPATPNIACR
jgi:hypothetical protein